jgi:phage baseplate assembly protein gpV
VEQTAKHFGGSFSDGGAFSNMRLRPGEVQAVYYPTDAQNVSKNFVEYQVLVQERSNSIIITRLYEHVIAVDGFGGIADYYNYTFRPDPSANKTDGQKSYKAGVGSKVLVLCINGEYHNACIIGGIRDSNGPIDVKENDGHRLKFRFNGVSVEINKDGELTLEYQGAMNADGTPADGVDQDTLGTKISIAKTGNVTIADGTSENTILIDHANGRIQLVSKNEVDVTAPNIKVGSTSSSEPLVLGNSLNQWMQQLIAAINTISVPTATGPSGPPFNAPVFQQLAQQFEENLSQKSFTEK